MLSKAEIKRWHGLARAKGREESGLFLAEGVRLAEEALACGTVLRTALVAPSLEDTPRGRALAGRLRATVRTMEATEAQLRDVAATESPQGVVLIAELPRRDLRDVRFDRGMVVLLDAVQDPGNFGTIVRSADAFGASAVIALTGTVDPWNPKAVRAAMGSSLRLPVVPAGLGDVLPLLRAASCPLLGADAAGEDAAALEARSPVALAFGNEGAGLGDEVRAACDRLVSIPMSGRAESLNVAVAAGILLYLMSRKS